MTPEQMEKCREAFEHRYQTVVYGIWNDGWRQGYEQGYKAAYRAAQPQWLPIESAPRNVKIRAAVHVGTPDATEYHAYTNDGENWYHAWDDSPILTPNFWQSLCAPPAQSKEGGEG